MIQASVAVYPLQADTSAGVERAISALQQAGVECEVGSMHTQILGSSEAVFAALQVAFNGAAELGPTVMIVTVSNACPLPDR